MSLAMQIIELAENEARKAHGKVITAIEVDVGQLAGVMSEALSFCLEAAARGTLAQGAQFLLNHIPGRGFCQTCRHDLAISDFPAQCPDCRGFGVTILSGNELNIQSISIEDNLVGEENV